MKEKGKDMQKKNGYEPNRREELKKEVVDTDNREPHEKVMMMKATGPKQPDSESNSLYSCERTYKENTRPGLKAPFNFPSFSGGRKAKAYFVEIRQKAYLFTPVYPFLAIE